MCRVCYGPSLSCAEFATCRVVPKSKLDRFCGFTNKHSGAVTKSDIIISDMHAISR